MLPELNPIELIFLGAVALIFIGPKDLPVVLRKVGQFTAKMRGLAAEFRASFDEMARQSELDELRKEVEALRNGQFAANTAPDLKSHVDEINQHLSTPYWDGPYASYDSPSAEAEEVAALPPPAAEPASPAEAEAAPRPARKRAPKAAATVAEEGAKPAAKPARKRAPRKPAAAPTESAEA